MNTKNSIGDVVLVALEKSIDGYIRFEDFFTHTHIYAKGYERPLKKSALAMAIRRLREKGFIEIIDDKNLLIKITDEGRARAIWEKIKDSTEVWDNKWRIVIFDIPESHYLIRDLFRRRLKEFAFKQLQKSVWISKINCIEILREYVSELGIKKWVSILEAENVDFG